MCYKACLITSVATGCGACVDIVYEHRALSVTDRGKAVGSYVNHAVFVQPPHAKSYGLRVA